MEQESIYVPSGKLTDICSDLLGKIYDHRQTFRENYVKNVTENYNKHIDIRNTKRAYFKIFGVKPLPHVVESDVEGMLMNEVRSLLPEEAVKHPMISIQQEYGQLEHEAKDALIMCGLADMVPVSSDMARGISHLGCNMELLKKPPFGFCK
jgi:hypothetical protein